MTAPSTSRNVTKPTRNGCRTCRIRKVKCDENKPACNRCTSTGRTCDGEIGMASVSISRRRLLPSGSTSAPNRIGSTSAPPLRWSSSAAPFSATSLKVPGLHGNVRVWPSLDLSNCERHGFQYFQALTAPALRLMLPSPGWIPVALQLSIQQPAIFHAITATGTMARALTVLRHPSFPRPLDHSLAEEAIRQYGKAITVLREYVDTIVTISVATEPILLACLLCVCFEALSGRKSAAVEHARLGWGISQDYPTAMQVEHSPSVQFFNAVFRDGAGASALFDDKEHHDMNCCRQWTPNLSNTAFGSIEEANRHLTTLAKASEHFRTELLQLSRARVLRMTQFHDEAEATRFCLSACLSRTTAVTNSQRSRLEQLQRAHMHWNCAYATCERKDSSAQQDIEGNLLRIKHCTSNFSIATCRDTEEMSTDRFLDDFAETLDWVEQYLAVARRPSSASFQQGSLFFGSSILPSLDLIAHKCRHPQLRRRAIRLLFSARKREGLEDSEASGVYAKAVAEVEEERARSDLVGIDEELSAPLPEQVRFSDVVTVGAGTKGIFKLICARYVDEGHVEMVEYEGGAMPLRLCTKKMVDIFIRQTS